MSDRLTDQLSSADWRVRLKAIQELDTKNDPMAESTLIQALSDDQAEVWQAAEKKLGYITSVEYARQLCFEAQVQKRSDPKSPIRVILPVTGDTITAYNAQGIVSSGSFSFQMPRHCIYCGKPVGQRDNLRATMPGSAGSATLRGGPFEVPCCAVHRAESKRNDRFKMIVSIAGFLLALWATWYLVPRIFADIAPVGRIILGFFILALAGSFVVGVLRGYAATILARLSPSYASLLTSPGSLEEGCIGLIISSVGEGQNALAFQFANSTYAALFYAANRLAVFKG